ncbi:guanylate kinase [bacterium]|nr:guanylate kinase [bacterium]
MERERENPSRPREGIPRGRFVILTGPSGVGKDTLARGLLDAFPFRKVITCTTRNPRGNEEDGKAYHFLDTSSFKSGINEGEFVEWAQVYDHYYGVRQQDLEEPLQAGENLLLLVDVQGAKTLHPLFPHALLLFIAPPNKEVLEERIGARGTDNEESRKRRRIQVDEELAWSVHADRVLVNDLIDDVKEELHRCIEVFFEGR